MRNGKCRGILQYGPTITIFVILLLYSPTTLHAQDYLFSVPRLKMDVVIEKDASAVLKYAIDFQNTPGAHWIDIVDIGLPHENYSIRDMKTSLDGKSFKNTRDSEYVKPGVEVHLPGSGIPPDAAGTFEFEARMGDLVFQDTTRDDYASFQITPTWFDGKFVQGTTDLLIRVWLPEGLKPEEILYQDVPFTGKEEIDGQMVVSWEESRPLTSPYRVGVSFPKRVMDRIVKMTISEMLTNWYNSTFEEGTRVLLLIGSVVALAFVFFRFTGGTGGCLFVVLLFILWNWVGKWGPAQIFLWPIILILGVIVETVRYKRKRRYMPAIASVEGGGIKRGLTAPEAAVLLELPVNKIATLVLFGMLKKGLIRQTKSPISFLPEKNPPADAIVQEYEKIVLKGLTSNIPSEKVDLDKPIDYLIKSVAGKMEGFDLEETREYYKHIVSRAWKEAHEAGDIGAWQKKMDEKVDWMMLDPDFNDRFRPYNDRYIPRSYRTTSGGGSSYTGAGAKAPSGSGSGPKFTDIAASVTGWMQNTSGKVVTGLEGKKGGILNLGGFDKAVGQVLKSGGSGGRSGGGGGCACACAGCACACACAGGGR